jgi:hypothetical protein
MKWDEDERAINHAAAEILNHMLTNERKIVLTGFDVGIATACAELEVEGKIKREITESGDFAWRQIADLDS